MPVRSRRQLLAGMGAMVGLCLAGAGCQSSNLWTDAGAPNGSGMRVARQGQPNELPTQAVVSIMRPIPAGGSPSGAIVQASEWRPVQRASADELPTVVPQAAPETVQVRGPGPMPTAVETPVAIEIGATAAPVPPSDRGPNTDKPANPDEATLLHPPAQLPGPVAIVAGADGPPKEFCKKSHPPYVVEPPDILLIQSSQKVLVDQPLAGQHLVRQDGFVSLGIYGEVYVSGFTLEQVRAAVTEQMRKRFPTFDPRTLDVDVIAYNSKVYYIITDGGGYGQQVYRIPVTGNETILDAMSQVNGLPAVASKKKIWLARATPDGHPLVYPVDWRKITMLGSGSTNYQMFPGDRLYVGADPWIVTDSWIAKRLAPVERLLGITLLGSSTVNSIRNGNNNTGNGVNGQ